MSGSTSATRWTASLAVRCDADDLEPWVMLQLRVERFREEAVMIVVHEQDAHGAIGGGSRHRWLSIADFARAA